MSVATISPQQLHDRGHSGQPPELIDVRTPVEYRELHVPFAKNVPLDQLKASELAATRTKPDEPLFVICRSGNRAAQACEKFHSLGYTNVVNVEC